MATRTISASRPSKERNVDPMQALAVIPTSGWSPSRVAWLSCALSTGLVASAGMFVVVNGTGIGALMFLVSVLSCAVVGGIVASRLPTNPVGWFFLVSALSFAATVFTNEYATYGLLTDPGSLPIAWAMVWPQSWLWVPGAVLILAFVPLYFPDGRLISDRWRLVVWFAVTFSVVGAIYSAFLPGEIQESGFVNPVEIEAQHPFIEMIGIGMLPLWLGLLFLSAASLVIRFRRSEGEQRQQIKWLAFAALVVPTWFLVSPGVEAVAPTLFEILDPLAFAGIPIATGIAILKYHLYDIDRIINRTLVYGALTACILGIYVLLVGYTGALFGADDNLLISVVATGTVALVFTPLREQLQRGVNRLMYGERDDPYAVLSRLGRHLKTTTAPESVLSKIVDTAGGALKLPYVAITLNQGDRFEPVAEYGSATTAEPLVLPLAYGTEFIGQLILSPRAHGEPFDPVDRRLLDDFARHAEAAAYAMLLTADLQRSRERLVNAREEERRRLRRDLHDGLGPQLATFTLKLDAARNLLAREPQAADAILIGLKVQTQTAISDIRRLVYDLRPPALDELGLVPAIREQATSFSQHGLGVSVEAPEELPPLPAAVEVAAYRIVQEALTNVVRHATAHACHVTIALGEKLELEITDDGIGLPEDRRTGVGLSSMRERAAELGGTLAVKRREPTGGTQVLACLPLPTSRSRP
ncbi:MAG: sensor histidine kinase [Chloroflexota bacterium]|nr:sensor histidine kinase [Chloroflexota bacterium]